MMIKTTFFTFMLLLAAMSLTAQNIELSFANSQVTNDGADDFYEVDVMIRTIDGQPDVKLGKGQLYINYNTAAFGLNIVAAGGLGVTHDNAEGYVLGDYIDAAAAGFYSNFAPEDNTDFRFSFSYQQFFADGTMATPNVTSTARKLLHIKMKYIVSGLDPMIEFELNEDGDSGGVNDGRDQFFTTCAPFDLSGGPFAAAVCTGSEPNFPDISLDNSGATLSIEDEQFASGIAIYPNPTRSKITINSLQGAVLNTATVYDVTGKVVLSKELNTPLNTKEVNMEHLPNGLYLLKLEGDEAQFVKRIVKM